MFDQRMSSGMKDTDDHSWGFFTSTDRFGSVWVCLVWSQVYAFPLQRSIFSTWAGRQRTAARNHALLTEANT